MADEYITKLAEEYRRHLSDSFFEIFKNPDPEDIIAAYFSSREVLSNITEDDFVNKILDEYTKLLSHREDIAFNALKVVQSNLITSYNKNPQKIANYFVTLAEKYFQKRKIFREDEAYIVGTLSTILTEEGENWEPIKSKTMSIFTDTILRDEKAMEIVKKNLEYRLTIKMALEERLKEEDLPESLEKRYAQLIDSLKIT